MRRSEEQAALDQAATALRQELAASATGLWRKLGGSGAAGAWIARHPIGSLGMGLAGGLAGGRLAGRFGSGSVRALRRTSALALGLLGRRNLLRFLVLLRRGARS